MSSKRHQRVSEIFLAARDLPPKERQVLLESASDGDESLVAEVEALLAEHDRLGGFLRSPALGAHFQLGQLQQLMEMGDTEAAALNRSVTKESIMAESESPGTGSRESSDPVEPQVTSSLFQRLLDRFGVVPPPLEQASADADAISMRLEDLAEHPSRNQRYVCEGEIGRGGMGAVLRVFDQHLRRRLAMKVARALPQVHGPGSPGTVPPSLARFLEEAQLTSQLEHPGVVPIHELGLDENHQVYFTMRLVRGRSLKEILPLVRQQREGWTLTRALGVLLRVCETMSYAHDRGVIHRDLKPSNVMVGRYGEVYVMDWGLARVVGHTDLHDIRSAPEQSSSIRTDLRDVRESEEDSPLVTRDGSVIGTPAYMSPEQAGGSVADVDRRSDVYALGAMLYHLLTGQPPFLPPGSRLSPYTLLALVLEGQPKSVHTLAPDVPAELTAICERAMAREPAQRFPDMSALAEDLRAYLEGRVVHAYETGAWAEARKWVRRNKSLAGSLAAAVVLLAAGLVTSSSLYVSAKENAKQASENASRAEENERLAKSAELRAHREAVSRGQVNDYLQGLFRIPDPEKYGRDVRLVDVISRASQELEGAFTEDPMVESDLRATIGWTLYRLGRLADGEPHLRRALELRRRDLGPSHPNTLQSINQLVQLLNDSGSLDKAEQLTRDAIAASEQEHGPDAAETLRQRENLGLLLMSRGLWREAQLILERTLEGFRQLGGNDDEDVLASTQNLAGVYIHTGRYEEAEQLAMQALDGQTHLHGPDHPSTFMPYNTLALALRRQDRLAEAEPIYRELLAYMRERYEPGHPETLTVCLNLARLLVEMSSPDRALDLLREAHEISASIHGTEHTLSRQLALAEASAVSETRRTEEADSLTRLALELHRRTEGADSLDLLNAMSIRAIFLSKQGRSLEAEELYCELIDRAERACGQPCDSAMHYRLALARFLANQRRFEEAEPHFLLAYEDQCALHGRGDPGTVHARSEVANFYRRWGGPERWSQFLAREAGAAEAAK